MADYTDGLGWAKLDTTAACHLGRIIENFSDKTRGARATMLLFCYSQIREAKVPYFRLGVRTIAKACGYSPKKAQQFLEYCEEREYFVTVESAKDGKTPKRTFWWLANEVYPKMGTGCTHFQEKKGTGVYPKSRGKGYTSDTEYQREESSKSDLSSPASFVSADATTEAGQMTTEVHFLRTEDVQPREDAIEVPQAEFDAQEEIFRQGIQEALDNIEQSKARSIDWEWHLYRESHKPVAGDDA